MLIVTGASGQLGRRVVTRLLDHVDPTRIGVSVRDPDAVRDLAERGVRVRAGDFADPGSLAHAFAGAERVLVVSPAVVGTQAVAYSSAAIDAAVAAGAERVLYTSHMGAAPDSPFPPMPVHAAVERHLAGAGVAFTALRNGFYASTVPRLVGDALTTGELAAPADGPVSWTTHDDLAGVAALALAGRIELDGPTPPLTAEAALDLEAVATLLGELRGAPVRRVVVSDDAFADGLRAGGAPPIAIEMQLGLFRAAREGRFAATDPALATALGRPATPVRDVLRALV